MGLFDSLGNFKDGAISLTRYAWVLYVFVGIAIIFFAAFMIKRVSDSKKQWTHKLRIRRVLENPEEGKLARLMVGEDIIKMRRFPLIKTSNVFVLQRPLLGKVVFPELDSYSSKNEYSIILDTNNRIYTNKGEYFDVGTGSMKVSARHSGIDNLYGEFDEKYGKVYEEQKKLELKEIMKFALVGLGLIFLLIVSIKGIDQWGENHRIDAEMKKIEAQAWENINEVLIKLEENQNVNLLLIPKLKELYGTNNLQPLIEEARNETIS